MLIHALMTEMERLGLDPEQPPDAATWRRLMEAVPLFAKTGHLGLEQTAACKSEQRFRELFDSSPDALFIEDRNGTVLDANPAACQLHGFEHDVLVGTHFRELVPPEYREEAERAFQSLVSGELERFEGCSLTASGRRVPVEIRGRYLGNRSEPVLLLQVRDMTVHKQYQRELIAAKELAEEASRLKTAFINNVSHEVRTPLAAIIGFAEILSEETDAAHVEIVRHIADSGKRLLNTLNSVLDLSMLESGTLTVEMATFDVVALVEEKVAVGRALAGEGDLVVDFVSQTPDLQVRLDRTCLDRILSHLVDNAIKFTDAGHVLVVVFVEGRTLRIRVRDTGIGIDPAFWPQVFEPFKQESTGLTRSHGGTGLGLTVTRRMVDLMGGTISYSSEKHRGTVFEVCFPGAVIEPPAMGDGLGLLGPRVAVDVPQRLRILAVEDSPDVGLLLEYMLKEQYDLVTARTETEALACLRDHAFDLVLMDINLGAQRTGEDLLYLLRAMPHYASIPVVAMTAYALLQDRERFLAAGFDGYLSKPFTFIQMQQVIRQVTQQREPASVPVPAWRSFTPKRTSSTG